MRGWTTKYSTESGAGLIMGENKAEYPFHRNSWTSEGEPFPGEPVDFTLERGLVTAVSHWDESMAGPLTKSRKKAALFAFFLGWTGAHKFYTDRTGIGVIHALPTIGLLSAGIGLAFSDMALLFFAAGGMLNAVSLIESIVYFNKTDEEFQRIYVDGKRPWF